MSHKKYRTLLLQDSSALSGDQRERLSHHLKTCRACRRVSQVMGELDGAIEDEVNRAVPDSARSGIWEKVRVRIEGKKPAHGKTTIFGGNRPRQALTWGIPSLAAVSLLVIFIVNALNDPAKSGISTVQSRVNVESAQIEGQDAEVSIFESTDPEMTFIWLNKPESINGG